MSWVQDLERELTARGVAGSERTRIIAELRDHIACDPGCEDRLGDPGDLASTFADQLATGEARRSAVWALGALAATAVTLLVSQAALVHGYPGYDRGLSQALFIPALLGMTIAPQVALVAGVLAAIRVARRRRTAALPAAELALIRGRAWVAIGAGLVTVAGLELYVIHLSRVLPTWWLIMVGGLSALAGVALVGAGVRVARAATITSAASGPAGDIFDDVALLDRRWLRRYPWALGALGAVGVGLAMTLFIWHAERSLLEGVQRGVPEAIAAAAGFLLLGRLVGLPITAEQTDHGSEQPS